MTDQIAYQDIGQNRTRVTVGGRVVGHIMPAPNGRFRYIPKGAPHFAPEARDTVAEVKAQIESEG